MSGTDDILREALADLSTSYRRDVVTDPRWIEELLAPRLAGKLDMSDVAVRAVVAAAPILREASADAPTTATTLRAELRKLGIADGPATTAANAWASMLQPEAAQPEAAQPEATQPEATQSHATDTVIDQAPPSIPSPPSIPNPPPAAPPRSPRPTPPASAPTPPAVLPPTPPPLPSAQAATAPTPAGVIGGAAVAPAERSKKRSVLLPVLLGIVALAAIVAAILGWTRDPSKDRALDAETEVASLTDDLQTSQKKLSTTETSLAERGKQLDDAKAQIGQLSSVSRAQLNSAQFPEQFTMTGKVAPGSCSLTGEACNVTAVVRAIKLTCATKPCDCTKGGCTVTSELWRTASAVTYDPATNLFTAKGLLDGDVFRCGGVAQPTNYEFRFRTSKIAFTDGAWRVAGVDAELAESAAANGDCLSGNRTYALAGPS